MRQLEGRWASVAGDEQNFHGNRIPESFATLNLMDKDIIMTETEYLEFEKVSPVRHEYVHGVLHKMAEETKQHNRVIGRLVRLLDATVEAKGCDLFSP